MSYIDEIAPAFEEWSEPVQGDSDYTAPDRKYGYDNMRAWDLHHAVQLYPVYDSREAS